ncbi:HNH endonuclease [Bacillus thermotolerans]|uniref:HNH nuclease domain-containing protein n=1 Tax=Bacillus thermotolerans TaxID=1221996 RepID=A0A0F5HPY3_BACTR|nr:HNH endonuclease [Bacillus thermotolerans]KKB35080.1 hypothetical protein QY95_03651 [Bacillus thermotolerans]
MEFSNEDLEYFREGFGPNYKYFNKQIKKLQILIDTKEELENFKAAYWTKNREKSSCTTLYSIKAIIYYRAHKIKKTNMSYIEFLQLYNQDRLNALTKLFLEPIHKVHVKWLDERLVSDSIETLFKLHKLQPSQVLFKLINQYGTLKERYERDLEEYKKRGSLDYLGTMTDFEPNVYSLSIDKDVKDFQKATANISKNNQQFSQVSGQRWMRDKSLAYILKRYYQNTCQLCEVRLQTVNGYISEVHHVQPYNDIHKGDDTIKNMIVLCPNCHSRFDDFYYAISPELLVVHCYSQNDPLHLTPIKLKAELKWTPSSRQLFYKFKVH